MKATGPLVLIVEDFEDAREMYSICLEHSGMRVCTASHAIEGIEMARLHKPDVILMDAGLPGMSGWDAVVVLKNDPATREIPVLMFTGHVLSDSERRSANAGADGFIPKPCLPDELEREIRAVLARPRGPRGHAEAEKRLAHQAIAATKARMAEGRQTPSPPAAPRPPRKKPKP